MASKRPDFGHQEQMDHLFNRPVLPALHRVRRQENAVLPKSYRGQLTLIFRIASILVVKLALI